MSHYRDLCEEIAFARKQVDLEIEDAAYKIRVKTERLLDGVGDAASYLDGTEAENERLQERVEELEERNKELEDRVKELERCLAVMEGI
jgi:chromosome segregation ATPase